MRWLLLVLALLIASPAEAGAGRFPRALVVLGGAAAGGAGGALIGAPIYGVVDPYRSDDGLEWIVIGAPAGFGLGAAAGGALTHAIVGGPKIGRVLGISAIPAVLGAGLVLATPALYEGFEDHRFAAAYVGGVTLAVLATPFTAMFASLGVSKEQPVVVSPMLGERTGLVLAARF